MYVPRMVRVTVQLTEGYAAHLSHEGGMCVPAGAHPDMEMCVPGYLALLLSTRSVLFPCH